MSTASPAAGRLAAHFVAPLLLALLAAAASLVVLHVALGHAMRARRAPGDGAPRWRLRDTLLVSPLLDGGLLVGFGALAHGLARLATDAAAGNVSWPHLAACVAVAAGAFVVAGFGVRAVGKLY